MNMTAPLLLAAILLLTTKLVTSEIKITHLKTPLLPFHLGTSRIIETKHTFIHFVEITPITTQLENMRYFYNKISDYLNVSQTGIPNPQNEVHKVNFFQTLFSNLLKHAKYLILEVENKLGNIKPQTRSKRGLLNLVGTTSKWLFGTLDAEDGIKYDEAIRELQSNQNFTMKEITMQVSLSKKLIDNYNATVTLLNTNQEIIKNRLNYLQFNMSQNIVEYLKAQNVLDQIILNCQNLIVFLDNLEDALTFAKLNTLHSTVISEEELEKIMKRLTLLYHKDKIPRFTNSISYYQLVGTQVTFSENKVIFAIHFPIFSEEIYEVFRLFPIPINNSTIVPNHPYILLGPNQQQYEDEMCPAIEDTYICHNHLEPQTNDCIAALIKTAEYQNCHTTGVYVANPIIEAISSQHIIAIPAEKHLKVQKLCDNNEFILIEKPSIIEVPFNCGVTIGNFKLWNRKEMMKGHPLTIPEIEMDTTNPEELELKPIHLQTIDIKKIHELQNDARLLQIRDSQPFHPAAWSLTSIPITLVVILAAFIAWKFYQKRTKQNKEKEETTPAENSENKPVSLLFSS